MGIEFRQRTAFNDPVNVRGKFSVQPTGQGGASLVVDTGTSPLAVFDYGGKSSIGITYTEVDPHTGARGLGGRVAGDPTGGSVPAVSLPAGKIVVVGGAGPLGLDRNPSQWPSTGTFT